MGLPGLFVLLIFVGLGGGYITKLINRGVVPIWAAIFPSLASGLLWGLMSRTSTNLSLLSAIFDVLYTASYVVAFVLLGDRLTPLQVAGFLVSLAGVAMMSK